MVYVPRHTPVKIFFAHGFKIFSESPVVSHGRLQGLGLAVPEGGVRQGVRQGVCQGVRQGVRQGVSGCAGLRVQGMVSG